MSLSGTDPHGKKLMRFEPVFNLGQIGLVVTFVLAATGAYWGVRSEIAVFDTRVKSIEQAITTLANTTEKLAGVVVTAARQDERLGEDRRNIERLVQEIDALRKQVSERR